MLEMSKEGITGQLWSISELAGIYDRPLQSPQTGWVTTVEALIANCGRDFVGGLRTQQDARDILDRGWQSGSDRLQSIMREITPPTVKSRQRRVTWRDDGDELSIDRAMRGQWDSAWRTSRRVWTAGPTTVTLVAGWGGNCDKTPEQLFWRSAAAAALTDVLESAGYRVRLIAGCSFVGAQGNALTLVDLKLETEPMRIDAIAGMLCHAGIFRSYGLRACLQMPFNIGGGHGQHDSNIESKYRTLASDGGLPEDAIVIGTGSRHYGREDAIAEIERVINQLGVES